jgi:hypothetical protein
MATASWEIPEIITLADDSVEIVGSDNGGTGVFLPKGVPIKIKRPDNPATPYELDLTTVEIDPTATVGTPVDIKLTFGDDNNEVKVIFTNADYARYLAGKILVEGVQDAWNPDQAVNAVFNQPIFIYRANAANSIVHDTGAVTRIDRINGDGSVNSSNHLKLAQGASQTALSPTYDPLTDTVTFGPTSAQNLDANLNARTILEFDSTISVGTLLIVFNASGTQGQGLSILGTPQRGMRLLTGNNAAMNLFNSFDNVKTNWDGQTDGSGNVSLSASYSATPGYNNIATTQVPVATNVSLLMEFDPAQSGVNIATLGGAFDGSTIQDTKVRGAFAGDILMFVAWPAGTVLPADYLSHVTGWAAWEAFNAGWTETLGLPADHAYGANNANSPPGGGLAPTVEVVPLVVTVTLTDVVEGSEVRINETGTSNEIAGDECLSGTTFSFVPSTTFDIEILRRGFKPFVSRVNAIPSFDQSIKINQLVDRGFKDVT